MSKHIIEFDLKNPEDRDDLKIIMQARNMNDALIEYAEKLRLYHKEEKEFPTGWSDVLKMFWNTMLDNQVSINE